MPFKVDPFPFDIDTKENFGTSKSFSFVTVLTLKLNLLTQDCRYNQTFKLAFISSKQIEFKCSEGFSLSNCQIVNNIQFEVILLLT